VTSANGQTKIKIGLRDGRGVVGRTTGSNGLEKFCFDVILDQVLCYDCNR